MPLPRTLGAGSSAIFAVKFSRETVWKPIVPTKQLVSRLAIARRSLRDVVSGSLFGIGRQIHRLEELIVRDWVAREMAK